jgi:hypothetical protein
LIGRPGCPRSVRHIQTHEREPRAAPERPDRAKVGLPQPRDVDATSRDSHEPAHQSSSHPFRCHAGGHVVGHRTWRAGAAPDPATPAEVKDDFGIVQGATLTLLALLIGFTLSMAVDGTISART